MLEKEPPPEAQSSGARATAGLRGGEMERAEPERVRRSDVAASLRHERSLARELVGDQSPSLPLRREGGEKEWVLRGLRITESRQRCQLGGMVGSVGLDAPRASLASDSSLYRARRW
jgi:hypothetical protein